ncbi:hypothetical protein O3M35_008298 [Rhynocoris fuscipes]|uniref:DUF3719 domain-containing protein n=1 Tax=Rhynocoris fuscipes TaxID=488301 RepID=A0AAW1DB24_9HEMI
MSDNSNVSYGEDEWSQCVEEESESDIGSRSTSSTLSWTDEAENGISEEMRNQYELFESALYSELDGEELPEPLLEEVAVWKQHSPHLRITGTQIVPTFHEVEDEYPEDYEEVLAAHSSEHEDVIEQFREQCSLSNNTEMKSKIKDTDALFEKRPSLKNKETTVHSENHYKTSPKKENQSFHILEETLEIVEPPVHRARRAPLSSRGCLNRHEYKCNHITEHEESTDQNLKPPSCRQRKLSPAKMQRRNLSSSFSASRASRRVSTAASARLPKRKSLVSESTPKIRQLTESADTCSFRHGILPPIQTIAITPKLPSKRANSAMLRFSKTLPRTRPNTSKNKPVWLTPIDDSDHHNGQKDLDVLPRGDGHLSPLAPSLPYCTASKQSKQVSIPRRWRY